MTSAFALGHICFDGDGNLLPLVARALPSTSTTASLREPETRSTSIIDVTWATATTKILKHVELIKAHALKQSGRPLRHAIAGVTS